MIMTKPTIEDDDDDVDETVTDASTNVEDAVEARPLIMTNPSATSFDTTTTSSTTTTWKWGWRIIGLLLLLITIEIGIHREELWQYLNPSSKSSSTTSSSPDDSSISSSAASSQSASPSTSPSASRSSSSSTAPSASLLSSSSELSTSSSSSSSCPESDIEYFKTLARLGGEKWLSLSHQSVLQENERYLAEIVVNTTTEHVLRQSSSLTELQPHNPHFRRRHQKRRQRRHRKNQETETPTDDDLPNINGPPDIVVDCKNPTYANVLTGNKDSYQKFIIDIALFGFDADYLEIRLHELYDYVDLFVVTEQSRTHKGVPKPIPIVAELLKGRLKAFRDKIDYFYTDVTDVNLQDQWEIEAATRSDVMNYVVDKFDNNNLTTTTATTKEVRVYVVQNDGDEIIERTAMAHFRECEVKDSNGPQDRLFFPSFSFKRNVAWLQTTYDMTQLSLAESQQSMGQDIIDLRRYLWRLGPTIQSMSLIRNIIKNIRYVDYSPSDYHMGLGSANHFSNPSDPKLMFVKMFSVVDSAPYFDDSSFWENALKGDVTCDGIRHMLMDCNAAQPGKQYGWVQTNSMGSNVVSFVVDHLPWIVRTPPYRYPWLYAGEEFFHQEQMLYEQCHS